MPSPVVIRWPEGQQSRCAAGTDWLSAARAAGVTIPTGCLGGSCGACEIEVNGTLVRACIATVPPRSEGLLAVEFASDPHW